MTNPYFANNATPVSFSCSFYYAEAVNQGTLYHKGSNTTSNDIYHRFWVDSLGRLTIDVNATNGVLQSATGLLSTATWYYAVFTLNSTGEYKIYLNGAEVATGTGKPTSWSLYQDRGASIGAARTGNNVFNGYIDEPRWHYGVRPAGTITTEYNNQNSPATFYTLGAEGTTGGGGWTVFGDEGLIQ